MREGRDNLRCPEGAAGFSLVEAFIVMVIIGILGMISWPVVSDALRMSNLQKGTEFVVNQVEFARLHAASRNRAYLVAVETASGTGNGRIRVHEGMGSLCTPSNFVSDGIQPEPVMDVKTVDFTEELSYIGIETLEPSNLQGVGLCIKPDGRVLRLDTGAPVTPAPTGYAAGEAVVTIRLLSSKGEATQHSKQIVIPYNGVPKVR